MDSFRVGGRAEIDVDLATLVTDLAEARSLPPLFHPRDLACTHTLPEEELRIRWRLAWYGRLTESGWAPPPGVREQIRRDRALLETTAPDHDVEALDLPLPELEVSPELPRRDLLRGTDVRDLYSALASRAVIEQAKGMIMLRQGCDEQAAFRVLVNASQRANRKLRDVAAYLVEAVSEQARAQGAAAYPPRSEPSASDGKTTFAPATDGRPS